MEASVNAVTPQRIRALIVDKKYPKSSLGRSGLYLYHAGTVKQVVDLGGFGVARIGSRAATRRLTG
ncbi:MAG: hypothetical protein LC114_15415 [Bryobacterales bacterium]|nr:hypothetical protein [Bryobacterales bacterium]